MMLLRSRHVALETEAGTPRSSSTMRFVHDAETFADQPRIRALQIERRRDADRVEARRQAAGNAPQIGELDACESVASCAVSSSSSTTPAGCRSFFAA